MVPRLCRPGGSAASAAHEPWGKVWGRAMRNLEIDTRVFETDTEALSLLSTTQRFWTIVIGGHPDCSVVLMLQSVMAWLQLFVVPDRTARIAEFVEGGRKAVDAWLHGITLQWHRPDAPLVATWTSSESKTKAGSRRQLGTAAFPHPIARSPVLATAVRASRARALRGIVVPEGELFLRLETKFFQCLWRIERHVGLAIPPVLLRSEVFAALAETPLPAPLRSMGLETSHLMDLMGRWVDHYIITNAALNSLPLPVHIQELQIAALKRTERPVPQLWICEVCHKVKNSTVESKTVGLIKTTIHLTTGLPHCRRKEGYFAAMCGSQPLNGFNLLGRVWYYCGQAYFCCTECGRASSRAPPYRDSSWRCTKCAFPNVDSKSKGKGKRKGKSG